MPDDKNDKLVKVEDSKLAIISGQSRMLSLDFTQIKSLSQVMAASGMFQDIGKDAAKAFVKILAGQEMGIAPFQALSDIHIIQGKATAGANIYAAKLKQSGKYDYRVEVWDDNGCVIRFYEKVAGKLMPIGKSEFTIADARRAGLLSNPTWSKYPRNMYFARAMTNGVRTYCPDALGGMAAYTPEELGDRDYIEAEQTTFSDPTPQRAEDEPVDPTLLEDDQDPDMPPDFLKYDREEEQEISKARKDTVHEPTDAELDGQISLPDIDEPKKGRK